MTKEEILENWDKAENVEEMVYWEHKLQELEFLMKNIKMTKKEEGNPSEGDGPSGENKEKGELNDEEVINQYAKAYKDNLKKEKEKSRKVPPPPKFVEEILTELGKMEGIVGEGKYRSPIKHEFLPRLDRKMQVVSTTGVYLDIDCAIDQKKEIEDWVLASDLVVKGNVAWDWAFAKGYLEATLRGNIKNFWERYKDALNFDARTREKLELAYWIACELMKEFCGKQDTEGLFQKSIREKLTK
ncbi:hypothetical protein SLA2020_505860 [Shorea laevis]